MRTRDKDKVAKCRFYLQQQRLRTWFQRSLSFQSPEVRDETEEGRFWERGWSCACGLVDNLILGPVLAPLIHSLILSRYDRDLTQPSRDFRTKILISHASLNICPQVPGCFVLFSKTNAPQKFYSLQPTLRLETPFVFLSDEKKGRLSLNHVI